MIKKLDIKLNRTGFWLDADVTYRQTGNWFGHTSRDLKLDVIAPSAPQDKPLPCILWVCGGGWLQMDHHAHLPNFTEIARAGYVIASVQYRLSNDVVFPGALQDVKGAIRFLRAKADRYQIDPEHIGIMGGSAGGHLTGLVGVTGNTDTFDEGDYLEYSSAVQAANPWFMISDLTRFPLPEGGREGFCPEVRMLGKLISENREAALEASPIHYVTEKASPFLLFHGLEDRVVPYEQSVLFHDALREKGITCDLYGIEKADHADQYFNQKEIMDRVISFFDTHLK